MNSTGLTGVSQVRPKTGVASARQNTPESAASASSINALPDELGRELERRVAVARAREDQRELEQKLRQGYVRHKLPYWQFELLTAAIDAAREQAQAHAGGQLRMDRALSDAEIDAAISEALVPPGEARPLGAQKKRLAAARAMARLIRDWSCSVGSEVVITSRPILQRALFRHYGLSVSLRTIDRARPLLAFAGVPLFPITHDHADTTRGLATVLPALPSRAVRKLALPISPEAELELATRPQAERLFDPACASDLATPHGLPATTNLSRYTSLERTREEPFNSPVDPWPAPKAPGGQRKHGDWRTQDEVLPGDIRIQAFVEFWERWESLGRANLSYRRHAPAFLQAVSALARYVGRAEAIRFVYELIERAAKGKELVPGRPFVRPQSLAALIPLIRFETRKHRRAAGRDRDALILAGYELASELEAARFAEFVEASGPRGIRLAGFAKFDFGPDGRLAPPPPSTGPWWRRPDRRRVAVLSGSFDAWRALRNDDEFFSLVLAACESVGAVVFTMTGERNLFLTEVARQAGLLGTRRPAGPPRIYGSERLAADLRKCAGAFVARQILPTSLDRASRMVELSVISKQADEWRESHAALLGSLVETIWGEGYSYRVVFGGDYGEGGRRRNV